MFASYGSQILQYEQPPTQRRRHPNQMLSNEFTRDNNERLSSAIQLLPLAVRTNNRPYVANRQNINYVPSLLFIIHYN